MKNNSNIQFTRAKKIPVWAKPFIGKTPAQFFEIFIPRKKVEALAGLMFAIGDLGVPLPDWVKNASMQFWKNFIGKRPLRITESVEDFGVLVFIIEQFVKGQFDEPQPVKSQSKLSRFVSSIAKKAYLVLSQEVVSKLTHEEKVQFYSGCVRGKKIIDALQNQNHLDMVPLASVYLVIAVAWREIEDFKDHAARIHWLKVNKVIKKIASHDEVEKYVPSDRSIYQAFVTIGLPVEIPKGKP